jgi:DNA polymerase delta subunit 3
VFVNTTDKMAVDFRTYLATELISESRTVSYRTLSRALKVHVNAAKCMLYEFYEHENKKKAGSIYATYILSGVKKSAEDALNTDGHTNGHKEEDESMPPSSPPPFPSSMLDPSEEERKSHQERFRVPVTTITIVREELLDETRAEYEKITSIHLYSLSPHRIQDLVALTDIGRDIFANTFVKEDPLIHNKTYGVIQNPKVQRRKGKRPIIEAAAPTFKAINEDSKPSVAQPGASAKTEVSKPTLKKENSATDNISKSLAKSSNAKKGKSDLFKSFAKSTPKPNFKRQDTGTSTSGTDTKITDADEEGESEDESLFLDTNTKKPATSKKRSSDAKKERDDKAAKLRKMMDSDDEEPAVPNVENASGVKAGAPILVDSENDEQMADGNEEVAWSESDTEKDRQKAPAKDNSAKQEEESVKTEPKRRRGKRKVMKKKTMKDEDGYLVTKEEVVWESFSEDEAEPKKPKALFPSSSAKSSSQIKGTAGKSGGKPAGSGKGGGGIMNFFGKK